MKKLGIKPRIRAAFVSAPADYAETLGPLPEEAEVLQRPGKDMDGNTVRTIGVDGGLVDVKVCAVNEVWSGLKFVRRVKDK